MADILPFELKIKSTPDNILRKVPGRPKNLEVRSREHLTEDEVKRIWFRDKAFSLIRPSIDRIDSTRGYLINNIQWMTHSENSSKTRRLKS